MQALILHGWPQFEIRDYFLTKHLKSKGYDVLTPNMFINDSAFSQRNILEEVKNALNGKDLDLIIGISLGGLITPRIAMEYPKAKLIFIASGSGLRSDSKMFNLLVWLARSKVGFVLLPHLNKLPNILIAFFYRLVNPFKGDKNNRTIYEQDMVLNLGFIKKIPVKKEAEILDFVAKTNNSEILNNLGNKALIFCGDNDILMGKKRGIELNQLLVNSKLTVSKGSHFNAFTEKDLIRIDDFLV